jgi:GMP synthase (glutamine-hydrolysing)
MANEKVLVIDFGGHYSQLIARKVREAKVYCDIYPSTFSLERLNEYNPLGIILTGEKDNVFADEDKFKENIKNSMIPVMEVYDETIKEVYANNEEVINAFENIILYVYIVFL